ncbi:SDR family oxidoreductase [Rhodococcus aerolatus]
MSTPEKKTALVVGVTGISGSHTAQRLHDAGWDVLGLSRRPPADLPFVTHVAADLTDPDALATALDGLAPTHLFFCSWLRQDTEAENIRVNSGMLRNVLDALRPAGTLQHAALVTGLKHYLGPFEEYASSPSETPFRETQPRLDVANFYYAQEDVLAELGARDGFTFSVHRAHTMIGWTLGNAMNMGVTLAVYATICRETGRPFVFPGSPEQWGGVVDVTDARLLARQLEWAATAPGARDEAFNTVNGDVFRWRQMWPVLAEALGVEPAEYPGHADPLEDRMGDAEEVWARVVAEHGLRETTVGELASWWHTDSDLGRPIETFADMTKARNAGFADHQDSRRTFLDLVDRLREENIIPRV